MAWVVTTDQSALDRSLETQLRPWLQTKTDAVANAAIGLCPVGQGDPLGRPRRFPQALRDTISGQIVGSGLDMRGRITANAPHALVVHEGSRAHEIRPRGDYRLRFYSDQAGGVVRAKLVNHRGTQPNPFLRNAAHQVLG